MGRAQRRYIESGNRIGTRGTRGTGRTGGAGRTDWARSTIAAAERKEDTITVILQTIRIGDLAVCGIPFEAFCEIGLDLKKRSPFPRTMVIGLANGRHGYLPTLEQHKLGGYETWLGTCSVQEDASVILTNNLLKMLAELAKAN